MPEAYRLPTSAPALVPVTICTGIRFSCSTFSTPMCAKPFDAPPPKAKATTARGLPAEDVPEGVWCVLGQPANPMAAKRAMPAR